MNNESDATVSEMLKKSKSNISGINNALLKNISSLDEENVY